MLINNVRNSMRIKKELVILSGTKTRKLLPMKSRCVKMKNM
jgi:hypothetical protein